MRGVEKGVVICSSSKDYELQSWNEQGEITKIEGMLTIAFSFIFSCSHIDSRKQLYLIIKIPYMVNMSIDKNTLEHVLREVGEKGLEYKQENLELESENKDLKEKVKELTKKLEEVEKLKKDNLRLKIISGETKSGWQKERDWIYRNNPESGEPEGYKCPLYFDINKVSEFKIFYNENDIKWCNFRHVDSRGFRPGYSMLHECYLWLKCELPEQKKGKAIKTKIQKLGFKEKNDIIKHLEESNENIDDLEYLVASIDFLWSRKGKKFETHDFQRESKISSSSTVQIYLKMFVRCNIILKLKKGWYIINIE